MCFVSNVCGQMPKTTESPFKSKKLAIVFPSCCSTCEDMSTLSECMWAMLHWWRFLPSAVWLFMTCIAILFCETNLPQKVQGKIVCLSFMWLCNWECLRVSKSHFLIASKTSLSTIESIHCNESLHSAFGEIQSNTDSTKKNWRLSFRWAKYDWVTFAAIWHSYEVKYLSSLLYSEWPVSKPFSKTRKARSNSCAVL